MPACDEFLRVMLVDDSAVIRSITRRWLTAEPDIEVVASCANGLHAVRKLKLAQPDVIVLDIEMPEMDGLTALPELLKLMPDVKVIMSSTLTRRNANVSFKALSLGAADYIAKPESVTGASGASDFSRLLVEKVRALGLARREKTGSFAKNSSGAGESLKQQTGTLSKAKMLEAVRPGPAPDVSLRPASRVIPQIVAIGSSTGGPQALLQVVSGLDSKKSPPIVITQHMPKTFTAILAEHISKSTSFTCAEGETGQILERGRVYIAPGDYHMEIVAAGKDKKLKLTQKPAENYCRPSVDPMFRTLAALYGPAVLAVILTGMGQDGLEGARAVCDAGGTLIGQDKETSVVWGMPGAVAQAGLCSKVLPLNKIADNMKHLMQGQR